jgi:hypothetical protein
MKRPLTFDEEQVLEGPGFRRAEFRGVMGLERRPRPLITLSGNNNEIDISEIDYGPPSAKLQTRRGSIFKGG